MKPLLLPWLPETLVERGPLRPALPRPGHFSPEAPSWWVPNFRAQGAQTLEEEPTAASANTGWQRLTQTKSGLWQNSKHPAKRRTGEQRTRRSLLCREGCSSVGSSLCQQLSVPCRAMPLALPWTGRAPTVRSVHSSQALAQRLCTTAEPSMEGSSGQASGHHHTKPLQAVAPEYAVLTQPQKGAGKPSAWRKG